jgi:two-component system sensor histidine kinase PilS (NtrC family)
LSTTIADNTLEISSGAASTLSRRTVHLFLILRLIVAALVVGAGIMIIQVTNNQFPVRPLYTLLALSVVTGGAVYAVLPTGVPFRTVVWIITIADVLLEIAVVHYSGGIGGQFSMIFCLTIVAAAFLLQMPGGLGAAAMSSVLFVGYGLLENAGVVARAPGTDLLAARGGAGLLETYMHVSVFFLVGAVGGYLADRINRNKMELESAETRLEQLRIDTDFIVSNMNSGVLVIDSDGFVVTVNPAAQRILGVGTDEVLMGHIDAVLARCAPRMADEMSAALCSEESKLRHEINLERDGNRDTPLGVSISLLRDTDGRKRGVISVFQDLTEVREMQERVRKADRLAAVGELSAGIAHELRNPLASISGSIELLHNEVELDGENRRLMELIMRESDRLDRIITDFLNFAKLRAPRKRPVDVANCLEEVLILVGNNAALADGIDIDLSLDELPPVRLDDEQIRQVFFNLVVNSCEAMKGAGRLEIVAEQTADTEVRLAFRDVGPGIETVDVDRLFEPFFTTKTDGTGLGLAIANKIVTAHGGTIDFANREGGGAEFTITLPVGKMERVGSHGDVDRAGRTADQVLSGATS